MPTGSYEYDIYVPPIGQNLQPWYNLLLLCSPINICFELVVKVLQSMNHVKWDVKDIKSQHNGYVDFLLQVC